MTGRIMISHGGGGSMTADLVREVFLSRFGPGTEAALADSAVLPGIQGRIAFTTDSFVVKPLFFRGGDIGRLAVCGTVNDLAVCGAIPMWLSAGFVIEEGFELEALDRIARSMADTAREAGVRIVTGDTKVVERGAADGLFVNTSGIGAVPAGRDVGAHRIAPGDVLLVSGTLGDHGIAVLSERKGISFDTPLQSDAAPLNGLIEACFLAGEIHAMRDLTRGGAAAALNELAFSAGTGVELDEIAIPVREAVTGACDILGLDPLTIANEGKIAAFVARDSASAILSAMRGHSLGRDAAAVGEAVAAHPGVVAVRTRIGGRKVLDMPVGEGLPRIC